MIGLIKALHVIIATILFGGILGIYSMLPLQQQTLLHYQAFLSKAQRFIGWLFVIAFVTGAALVHPKGFTFTTPWIKAAFLLLALNGLLFFYLARIRAYASYRSVSIAMRWQYHLLHGLIFLSFIAIIHDAVSKHTYLSFL